MEERYFWYLCSILVKIKLERINPLIWKRRWDKWETKRFSSLKVRINRDKRRLENGLSVPWTEPGNGQPWQELSFLFGFLLSTDLDIPQVLAGE